MALQKKPPVVTIMGHVDHGKTSLLDFIRQSKLTAKEAGEITQAIGAYQIEFNQQKITFIDTPGHAAFTQMRARGATAADIVVLVVAATDGVMPQTKESLKIIKEAGVPFLVAINKIDLPEAVPEKVKAQLTENEVFVEGYGGDIVAVTISAKTGQGIDHLLEMIQLTADITDLKADPEERLLAVIIESKADKLCGPVAALIVQNGQLNKGDQIRAGEVEGKVKMLKDEFGKPVEKALPGDPVLVLGFESLPVVGSVVVPAGEQRKTAFVAALSTKKAPLTADEEQKKIKITLKADVCGSLEAIMGCLPGEVQVLDKGVGEITESDVLLAKTLGATIYAFNLAVSSTVQKLAEMEKVKIREFKIIYDLFKNLEERVFKMLEPTSDRKIFGKAEILAVFVIKGEKVAGAKVLEGKINKSYPVALQKGDKIIGEARIVSLKQGKQDVSEAIQGSEFGAVFSGKIDFAVGDVISSYNPEDK